MTAYEIATRIWGNVAVTQAYLMVSEVLGHVDLLLNEGKVSEVEDDELVRFAHTSVATLGVRGLSGLNRGHLATAHSYAPPCRIWTRIVAVSFGAITCTWWAVVQRLPAVGTCVTPTRNETVSPGPSLRWRSVVWPKKSLVVRVLRVGSARPTRSRNRTPG